MRIHVRQGSCGGLDLLETYLLATNYNRNLNGQLLLELLNSSSQTLALVTALGIVVVGLVKDLGGLEGSQSRSSSHLLSLSNAADTSGTSPVEEHHRRHYDVI
jgi:hypothetical protein